MWVVDARRISVQQGSLTGPRVTLTHANATAASSQYFLDSSTITGAKFDIGTVTPSAAGKTYERYYQVIQ